MDEILHHFETREAIGCWYLQGNHLPGFRGWCELDFATIHSRRESSGFGLPCSHMWTCSLTGRWHGVALFSRTAPRSACRAQLGRAKEAARAVAASFLAIAAAWLLRSSSSHPFFGWEGSPTKIDHRKKATLIRTSPLEDLGKNA